MSRTYHHGSKAKARKFEGVGWGEHLSYIRPERGELLKRKRYVNNWAWMKTPGWWVHDMMTVPQRAEVRQLIGKTLRMQDVEDAPLFPLAKKPYDYYW